MDKPIQQSRNKREGYYAGYYQSWYGRKPGHRRWTRVAMQELYPRVQRRFKEAANG